MVVTVCHVFGVLPEEALRMTYRHFIMLYSRSDDMDRRHAMYTAMAFNEPQRLWTSVSRPIKVNENNLDELLMAVNGR